MRYLRIAARGLVCLAAGACADISGLSGYSVCDDPCGASGSDASVDASKGPRPGDDATFGDDSSSAPDVGEPDAPSPTGGWTCAKGGCNASGGACSGPAACHCTRDGDCPSARCVVVAGQNDVACGGACTGAGAADGFGCALESPGIPGACTATAFGFTPSNFAATAYAARVPAQATTIDCNVTYDVAAHAFTACSGACSGTFCTGATPPVVVPDVAQANGPAVDVLVFAGLALAANGTLTIASSAAGGGGNAAILAVYGDAIVAGAIHADGAAGVTGGDVNTNTPGASGPGGNTSCAASSKAGSGLNGGPSCQNATNDCRDSGGGGGGGSAAGGDGAPGANGNGGKAGTARANVTLSPLSGACPGGTSGGWACTTYGGGGGGAVQISAAGALTVTGSITANGGPGGTSTCSAKQSLCGNTNYPGGGGGGGGGGAILLEAATVSTPGTLAVNGGSGGAAQGGGAGGAGGTSAATTGKSGSGSDGACGSASAAGGGGGGGYGYLRVNGDQKAATYACVTSLTPVPACNASHSACLCVDDADCASGKCVNVSAQCTGMCTGSGTPDVAGCQAVDSRPP